MTEPTGEDGVAPNDSTSTGGGEKPETDPPGSTDQGAPRDGGTAAPPPSGPPTADHTVELKAADVDIPDIDDVFAPPAGEGAGSTPAPPRPPERPVRPSADAAPPSAKSDDATEPPPAEAFDPNQTSIFPAGDVSTYNPDGNTEPPPAEGVDPAKAVLSVDIFAIATAFVSWTAVLTVAIGCVVVAIMKGPAYVADPYPVSHSNRPRRHPDSEDRGRG